ncbi:MAG: IS110 family transposase [Acidobacteria bacterium]|nr:IS110 family transposase [Acidobacteriota bacterium]
MEAIVARCCGLDVHQASVVACLLVGRPNRQPKKEVRRFGTTLGELEMLAAWLSEAGCTHVGMESTGVYWMPVYRALEGRFDLVVGNATHIKAVPGRKTDVKDAEWIADLLRHGLIRKSFVPPRWQRDLRDLVRYRRKLIHQQTGERNRLMKMLEVGGIKLSSVASDVFGVSGRAMVRALIEGVMTPEQMAGLARGSLRKKVEALAEALRGHLGDHHRFLLRLQLERIERTEHDVAVVDARIDEALGSHQEAMDRLAQIPGVDRTGAMTFLAEAGPDMSVFPTSRHLAAWAGVCPGNNESAGKRTGKAKRRGNVHLTTALVQAAAAASRKKGSYLKEKFWRVKARRGYKRALLAVAHRILVSAYEMLSRSADYRDLGAEYLDKHRVTATRRRLVSQLKSLGYEVTLAPAATATA